MCPAILGSVSEHPHHEKSLTSADLEMRYDDQGLADEAASLGCYSGRFVERDVRFSTVASGRGVRHRYDFPEGCDSFVVVDASAGGLLIDAMATYPQGGKLHIDALDQVSGTIVMEGVPIHFTCRCEGGNASPWQDDEELVGATDFELGLDKLKFQPSFGVLFRGSATTTMELSFGFSLQEAARTVAVAGGVASESGEALANAARKCWDDVLSKVSVEGGSEAERQVFHTALYRSSIKPADFNNENPFRPQPGP